MLSRFPSPLNGVYIPSQMIVNKPLNSNDEDLVVKLRSPERESSEPTVMPYFLQRILLAELCRHRTDHSPFINSNDEAKLYNDAFTSDSKIQAFISDFPVFFCLDRENRLDFVSSNAFNTAGIMIQRYMLNALVQIQRCKLHLP